ncbi:unnamed protein product [Caenorhabditis nigoni]
MAPPVNFIYSSHGTGERDWLSHQNNVSFQPNQGLRTLLSGSLTLTDANALSASSKQEAAIHSTHFNPRRLLTHLVSAKKSRTSSGKSSMFIADVMNILSRVSERTKRAPDLLFATRINCLRFNNAPAALKKLNCIESLLIQKARVVQTIVNLKDTGGRTTAMKGCGGPMVVVPVNVQESANTILETLPSASNMRIVVNTEWDKQYLVCIERVLKASTWLKANNPQYHDIHIDSTSTLRLGQDVVFEDSSKTQEDVNSLIRQSETEGCSILEASPVIQPIQPVNQPPAVQQSDLMMGLCEESLQQLINDTKARIKQQLTASLVGSDGLELGLVRMRQLARYSYHVYQDDGYEYDYSDSDDDTERSCNNDVYRELEQEVKDGKERNEVDVHDDVHTTLARLCDEKCPSMELSDVHLAYEDLMGFAEDSVEELALETRSWLTLYKNCCQCVRTLLTRIAEVDRCQRSLSIIQTSSRESQYSLQSEALINSLSISQEVKDKLWEEFNVHSGRDEHTEQSVLTNYLSFINAFRKDLDDKRDKYCDVCWMMSAADGFQQMSRSSIAFALEGQCQTCAAGSTPCDDCGMKKFNVCRICIRPIRKGEVPQLARINGLGFKEAPAELYQLNCIESLLIQKARVIQTIGNLKDIGGRTTAMKGCGGPMVVIPVNVQESVNTILKTLPSASNMRIVVNTEWDQQYLVCIERVLKALTWANNPEYHDIRIDPAFTLRLGRDVVFEDSSKTQEDVHSLIIRSESDGGSILESSTVEG